MFSDRGIEAEKQAISFASGGSSGGSGTLWIGIFVVFVPLGMVDGLFYN